MILASCLALVALACAAVRTFLARPLTSLDVQLSTLDQVLDA